jgi:hypothetical protein
LIFDRGIARIRRLGATKAHRYSLGGADGKLAARFFD